MLIFPFIFSSGPLGFDTLGGDQEDVWGLGSKIAGKVEQMMSERRQADGVFIQIIS